MFFHDWESIWRTLLVGTLAYVGLVVLLRISGKRTLSKMNAFDFVVTVALGSTLATIILSKDVPLSEGMAALALLILLQFLVAWSSVRSRWFSSIVKSQPTLLLYRGKYLERALKRERVTEEEVMAAVRSQGIAGLEEVLAVVLETDGSFTVVHDNHAAPPSALDGVQGYRPEARTESQKNSTAGWASPTFLE